MLRHNDGFTLIESIVAMGLVVSIAAGSAQLFGLALARNLAARQQLAMSLLASTKVNDLAAAAADGTIALPSSGEDTAIDGGRTYRQRWTVSRVDGFGDDAAAIAVTVTPVAGAGEVRVATIREWTHP
jgi:prepilin-type N-terminal cleavage/methylation domain-containing protein